MSARRPAGTRILRLSAGAALALVATACVSVQVGRDFDPQQFESRVERGVTPRATVREWLGEPAGRGIAVTDRGERFDEWTYYYGRSTMPGLHDVRLKILQIRFDAAGRVSSYTWSAESGR